MLGNSNWNRERFLKAKKQCNSHSCVQSKMAKKESVKTYTEEKIPKTTKILEKQRTEKASQ